MALGWLTVLKTVPWSQVLSNAPVVAEGARKLWNAVGPATPPPAPAPAPMPDVRAGDGAGAASALAALEPRLAATDAAVAELQGQMRASSELIKALADQNAALIEGMKAQRARSKWLAAGCGVALVAALAGLALHAFAGAA